MKKSWRGFVLWLAGWMALLFAVPFLPVNEAEAMRLVCNVMTLGIALLTHMICRNECVHWYTGVTFEEAEAAGSRRRLAYAQAHRKRFCLLAVIVLAISAISHALNWSMWIDFTVACAGLIAVAFSTMLIKL